MEAARLYDAKAHHFRSPLLRSKRIAKPSLTMCGNKFAAVSAAPSSDLTLANHFDGLGTWGPYARGSKVGCVALDSGSVAEFRRELDAEEEEWMKLGRVGDKCKEREGVLRLIECLETEAIMGNDEGKDPTDYYRRAQIFDKSSRVFQALKQLKSHSSTSQH